ncbi:hypothetical protein KR054_007442, partial [Drosophila jambulina]
MNKVDQETKRKWNESLDYGTLPSWPKCVEVVERHCQYLEAVSNANSDANTTQQITTKQRTPQQHPGYTFSCSTPICHVCSSSEHKTFRCSQLSNTSVDHRFQIIKKLGLCINCFGKGHHVAKCPSTQKCRICSQSHHTMLHREVIVATPSPPLPSQPRSNAQQISNAVVHTHRETQVDRVILATALVLVKDASGCYRIGRALLDSCSQVNFMSDEFAQALRIPRIKRHMEIRSIGESQTQIKHSASTTIKSRFNALELSLDFCITSHIAYSPDSDIDISSWHLPQNTPLADDKFNRSRRIDLLLGTETFFEILSVGQIKLGPHLPILQKTLLGWIISGRCQTKPTIVHSYSITL